MEVKWTIIELTGILYILQDVSVTFVSLPKNLKPMFDLITAVININKKIMKKEQKILKKRVYMGVCYLFIYNVYKYKLLLHFISVNLRLVVIYRSQRFPDLIMDVFH